MLTESQQAIGRRVREFRKERGLSQDELADRICSRQTISLLENGQHFPSADIVQKIAKRLSVPFHEIMMNETDALELKVQVDVVKAYLESGDYENGLRLIEELEVRENVLEFQRRELTLCKAKCLLNLKKIDEGIRLLEEFKYKLEQQRDTDDRFMANLYNILGSAYVLVYKNVQAHAHYTRAYQLVTRFSEFDVLSAWVTYNLGLVSQNLGFYSEAVSYFEVAREHYEKIADLKKLADTMFMTGKAYTNMSDYQQASPYLEQALSLYRSEKIVNMAQRVKQQYATYVLAQKEPDLAIQELLDCVEEFAVIGDKIRVGTTFAYAASICLDHGKAIEAEEYMQKGIQQIPEASLSDDRYTAGVYKVYARYNLEIKEYDKAIEYALKCSEAYDKMGMNRETADSLEIAVQAFRNQGKFEQALDLYRLVVEALRRSQVNQVV